MNGSIPKERLDEWFRQRDLEVPSELAELWQETGGGNLFESETILGPFGDVLTGDDVDSVNEVHRGRGLNRGYLIMDAH